jgi:ribonuclease T1
LVLSRLRPKGLQRSIDTPSTWLHWKDIVKRTLAIRLVGAYLLTMVLGGVGLSTAYAKGSLSELVSGNSATISVVDLPKQGRETYVLIQQGGPFAYDKDGTVFGNRERILPAQKRGYYREYTVKTPYARNRGAKRIVCGGTKPAAPDACFYSDDHYASFKRIVQ